MSNQPTPSPITSGEALKIAREALEDVAKWTERYTSPGHPVTTVARRALETTASAASAPVAQSERDAWISVDERLPANGEDVIVLYWPYNNRENAQAAVTAHHMDGVFYDEDGNDMHPPSHWMPFVLPAIAAQQPAEGGEAQP